MIRLRRIRPDDGPLLRRTRLAALADSPGAFVTTIEQATARSAEHWDTAAAANASGMSQATFFAEDDAGETAGMVGAYVMADGVANMVGLWSAPGYRSMGVADALVAGLVDWAQRSGAHQLRLWVLEGNDAARQFYADKGFETTGATMPYERDPRARQVEMIRRLAPPT
jgi:ribosomal protein S18 acetylase RimI-like enzyme